MFFQFACSFKGGENSPSSSEGDDRSSTSGEVFASNHSSERRLITVGDGYLSEHATSRSRPGNISVTFNLFHYFKIPLTQTRSAMKLNNGNLHSESILKEQLDHNEEINALFNATFNDSHQFSHM